MGNIHKDKVDALIHRIGLKYQLTDDKIREIVEAPYRFAHEIIKELDTSKIKTEEELNELKTNFYFKNIGKLHIPFARVEKKNKRDAKSKWKK